ncbi:MAG TPA: glycolate oxidase subunit GlcF [Gammaproteobacteria bacterium]|nr:glycolate oxidase subunit GlcF [Gammaproteobacteria bacterium]
MQTRFSPTQLADPGVAASEQILRKCVHCGFCTATCPTYVLLGDELDSPRGRIYLIKEMLENDRPATAEVVTHVDRCLSCLACMTTCPSGVHYQHLIDHARMHVERTYRRPLHERVLRGLLAWTLPFPGRFRAALALAALARPFALLLPRRVRAMLELTARRAPANAASVSHAGVVPAQGTRRARVALLLGCVQNVLDPEINAATIRLLTRAGAEVVSVPGCCGSIVHHLGRERESHSLAASLIERLHAELERGLDAIVVNASGCGTQVKDYGFIFRDDAVLAAKAAAVSAKARDVTEALAELGLPPVTLRGAPAVAYHSACSMQHGQKLDAGPRKLLREAGFEVREIAEGHLCCGSAGTYNVLQPEIATRLRERKLANVARTGAPLVATGNIGCITQLAVSAAVPVVHTVQLLDWATGGPAPVGMEEVVADRSAH